MAAGAERELELELGFGIAFAELYTREGLLKIDAAFLAALALDADATPDALPLNKRLAAARQDCASLSARDASSLMLALAAPLEDFIARLFGASAAMAQASRAHSALAPLFACKRRFVQRLALKKFTAAEAETFDGETLNAALSAQIGGAFDEDRFAEAVLGWMDDEQRHADSLDLAARYSAWAALSSQGRARHCDGVLFKLPAQRDPGALPLPLRRRREQGVDIIESGGPLRDRDGFDLTDPGCDLRHGLNEAHYCIFCAKQGNDGCSKGLRERKSGALETDAHGRARRGCPLEVHISEMNEAKAAGLLVAALACVTVANPLCAGTGHRICNDCMLACIYQRQNRDPVAVPEIESRVLKDVLALPWGFEIYSLLTRWNPLNFSRPLPAPETGRTALVVGLGPAGYTLAHHLLNDGHAVAAVDGLKIEPLAPELGGVTPDGSRVPFRPVFSFESLREPLGKRTPGGFGGVAEYGITARWDKNFLQAIRLLLERRSAFTMIGGVRYGGAITEESAFAMGFDHVALCMGAGRPTILKMENGMAGGVRQASDFLMSLQLTGAARRDGLANLSLRLPVAVIGGGLTAIDSCTEALAYYPLQVEKFLERYEILAAEQGEETLRRSWSEAETETAEEWLLHGKEIRAERRQAAAEGRSPRFQPLLARWGGATLLYRRTLQESPAFRNNPEEIAKALEEGVGIVESASPLGVEIDEFERAAGLRLRRADGSETVFAARSIIVAAGTVPNVVLAREHPNSEKLAGAYFQAVDENGVPVAPDEGNAKPEIPRILHKIRADGRAVSFFGDQHPSFAGNVVSAMASALRGYPVVSRLMNARPPACPEPSRLAQAMNAGLRAGVHEVRRLAPGIVEIVVKAPLAARAFRPGQFYRLQNFEALAPCGVSGAPLTMEGVALTGAWVDREAGLLGMIALETGGSTSLVADLKPGEPVTAMGPTGAPTEIPGGETVLLAGGGLGNAVLFSIGCALREAGSRVLYFAGYKSVVDRVRVEDVEAAADEVVWCCDEAPGFAPSRPGDKSFVGSIVAAMAAYAAGELGRTAIAFSEIDRIVVIGSDRMMRAVREARHGVLKPYLKEDVVGIGSINAPMQCMMKEICAQCLQPHADPRTGETSVVFTCFNQDQPLDLVDFKALRSRLEQNGVQEKLTAQWIARERAALH